MRSLKGDHQAAPLGLRRVPAGGLAGVVLGGRRGGEQRPPPSRAIASEFAQGGCAVAEAQARSVASLGRRPADW